MREFDKKGVKYKGVLYAGLMIKNGSFKVLEFNARLGDPEAQVILPLLDSDFVDLAFACIDGKLDEFELKWKKGFACCVVLASKGYPSNYKKGFPIRGLENVKAFEGVVVFHSGTIFCNGGICTNGGRVMSIVGVGKSIEEAIEKAYVGVSQIDFEGMHFRTDIGKKALPQE
jgi:phosphoribosylamine--glycine ligase